MRGAVLLATGLVMALASRAPAQVRTCDLVESGQIERRDEGGIPMVYFLDPFFFRCSDGAELRARSGVLNEGLRRLELDGDVFFQDAQQTLTSDEAEYSSAAGHLEARGNVVFRNREEGSELRGPELEYFRATEERPEARVTARSRPHLTLRRAEGPADQKPLEIDADRVLIVGRNDLTATGNVVIEREDLTATAGEARYVEEEETLDLSEGARIETEQYQLAGQEIQARLREGDLEHVRAVTAATLRGDRLSVDAPELQLFFADEQLQRTVARAPGEDGGRALAVTPGFRLEADSLDALMPGQQLQQVVAIGAARGETLDTLAPPPDTSAVAAAPDTASAAPDSAALALALPVNDWIAGDTVIGYFAPDTSRGSAPGDSVPVSLTRIVASGDAQSLYRVAPQQREGAPPPGARQGINFLAGETIVLTLAGGELEVADVAGLKRGVYLEPLPPAAEPAPAPDETDQTEAAVQAGER